MTNAGSYRDVPYLFHPAHERNIPGKRAAEVLVPQRIALDLVAKAVVCEESLRFRLRAQGWDTPVEVRQDLVLLT